MSSAIVFECCFDVHAGRVLILNLLKLGKLAEAGWYPVTAFCTMARMRLVLAQKMLSHS